MREAATVGSLDERGGDMQRNGATKLGPFLNYLFSGFSVSLATEPPTQRLSVLNSTPSFSAVSTLRPSSCSYAHAA